MRQLCAVFLFLFTACSNASSNGEHPSDRNTTTKQDSVLHQDSTVKQDSAISHDSTKHDAEIPQEPSIIHINDRSAIESMVQPGAINIIIVRHAEKSNEASQDPQLSAAGVERANELARLMENVHIKKIYSTPFKRTSQTVQSLASAKHLEITTYAASMSAGSLVATAKAEATDGAIVIVGHSNTVPEMIKALGFTPYSITESDFDNIFVYRQNKNTSEVAKWHLTYGRLSE